MLRSSVVFSAMLIAVGAGSAVAAKNDSGNSAQAGDSSGVRVTEVRDWAQVDKNRDNYVSPEEMEAYLQQYQARTGKNTAAANGGGTENKNK